LKSKNIKSELKYFLLLLSLSTFFFLPVTNARAASNNRYYAGYIGYNNPQGVKGTIFTEDAPPPLWELFAEWVDIRISYSPNYWIQTGYTEHWIWILFPFIFAITIDFYLERVDALGHWVTWSILKPIVGHTYTYELYYEGGGLYPWTCNIYEWQNLIWGGDTFTSPAGYLQLQALVETSVTSINIDGSHFTNLKYYDGSNWYLWSSYIPYYTRPYYVQPVHPYEFYASGGG
jgi:hypothetical protein